MPKKRYMGLYTYPYYTIVCQIRQHMVNTEGDILEFSPDPPKLVFPPPSGVTVYVHKKKITPLLPEWVRRSSFLSYLKLVTLAGR